MFVYIRSAAFVIVVTQKRPKTSQQSVRKPYRPFLLFNISLLTPILFHPDSDILNFDYIQSIKNVKIIKFKNSLRHIYAFSYLAVEKDR